MAIALLIPHPSTHTESYRESLESGQWTGVVQDVLAFTLFAKLHCGRLILPRCQFVCGQDDIFGRRSFDSVAVEFLGHVSCPLVPNGQFGAK